MDDPKATDSGSAAPTPEVLTAPVFADLEPLRAAWDRTARSVGRPLAGFDLARARSRADASVLDGQACRLVTVAPGPDGADELRAAVPWTVERLRGPLTRLRLAATAGSATGFLPAPILFSSETTASGPSSAASIGAAWNGVLRGLEADARPDAVEIGPLPLDSPAWEGLLVAMADPDRPFRTLRSRTTGAWVRLSIGPDDGATWRPRVARDLHRLRRTIGPERCRVITDPGELMTELHELDRHLRRTRGGGFAAAPGGRELMEGVLRALRPETLTGTESSARDDMDPDTVAWPIAVRLEQGDRPIARAMAVVQGQRAVVLAVSCIRDDPWGRFAPGRLIFARLVDELTEHGVRTVEAGPAAAWFADRAQDASAVPLHTALLVPADRPRPAIEQMTGLLGRLPSLGPFERIVRRLRPWAMDPADAAVDAWDGDDEGTDVTDSDPEDDRV